MVRHEKDQWKKITNILYKTDYSNLDNIRNLALVTNQIDKNADIWLLFRNQIDYFVCKTVICVVADAYWNDHLKNKKDSGFDFMCKHMEDVKGFGVISLMKNHRHEIVESILGVYKGYRD